MVVGAVSVHRSLKISEQIDMLGKLLATNGIDVKVNKYNILTKVSDYIKELQEKTAAAALDAQQAVLKAAPAPGAGVGAGNEGGAAGRHALSVGKRTHARTRLHALCISRIA